MIRIQSNIKEYLAKQERRVKALKYNPLKITRQTASLIRDRAKAYAPRKSGALASGVISRNTKNGATVYAFDPLHRIRGTNRLAQWADKRTPLYFNEGSWQVFYAIPQLVTYGEGAISPNGKRVKWTGATSGDAGYFTLAVRYGRRHFRKEMVKAINASINGIKI